MSGDLSFGDTGEKSLACLFPVFSSPQANFSYARPHGMMPSEVIEDSFLAVPR